MVLCYLLLNLPSINSWRWKMVKTWSSFEERIRGIASFLYGKPCEPRHIGGVDIDGCVSLDPGLVVLIEMTERRSLAKAREDITKLRTAKDALASEGVFARCYCVVEGNVTRAMVEAGEPHHIIVQSAETFTKTFFDFDKYRTSRLLTPFGSAVNPLTGVKDDSEYVPVKYVVEGTNEEVETSNICDWLRAGRRIILIGEYGSGKSRCIREVFRALSEMASQDLTFPMAIDLRECWGLKRGQEILRRHFEDLGLGEIQNRAIAASIHDCFTFLLDGFDEIGSQAWSNDSKKLKVIREHAFEGVRGMLRDVKSGVLITGREHYFPNNEEMLSALGLLRRDVTMLRCKSEFTQEELQQFFETRSVDITIPSWLPRRPLICQTITDLSPGELESMFGVGQNEVEFWNHFIHVLCERDARIHSAFDADTILSILTHLARITRTKPANVGPISLAETQRAFEAAVGQMPVEEASVALQRLPSLGRLNAESNDRQFVDVYILDGLRARDVAISAKADEPSLRDVLNSPWINPLDDLGLRVLSALEDDIFPDLMRLARRSQNASNRVIGCDIVASSLLREVESVDFKGLSLDNGHFIKLDMRDTIPIHLQITNATIGTLVLPASAPLDTTIKNCAVGRVFGVASKSGLPKWIEDLDADEYDSTQSVSRIRRIGLSPGHEMLVTMVRKTFFQKGGGRKEEALVRGLGNIGGASLSNKVLRLLLREKIFSRFRGDDGWVYAPERNQAGRMTKMLEELNASRDPLWQEVANL
jgi:hypothetical protein